MKLKKGDTVFVTAGKDKGQQGKIEKVFPKLTKVLVAGVNFYKKHIKRQSAEKKGQIIQIAKPLPVASVILICPKCQQKTRIGYKIYTDKKTRICKKCGAEI